MTLFDIILMLATLPFWVGLGRLLLKDTEPIPALLVGIGLVGGLIAATCRVVPLFSRDILLIGLALGAYQLFKERQVLADLFRVSTRGLVMTAVVAIVFREFHYTQILYEPNMVVYFDPGIEMLNADYMGNLRVGASYPSARAAMHLTPTGVLACLLAFIPKVNLFHFVEARYVLTVVFVSDFILRFVRYTETRWPQAKKWLVYVALACAGVLYASEMTYNITISSFLYVFCLLRLFTLSCEERWHTPETLFVLLMLCAAKAPILLVAVAFTAWYVLRHRDFIWRKEIILIGLVFVANAWSWAHVPPPTNEQGTLSFLIPRHLTDFDGGAVLRDPFLGDPHKSYGFQLIYAFVKVYGIFFVALLALFLRRRNFRSTLLCFTPYMLFSICDLLFVRDTHNTITHQRQAYYVAASVTSFAVAESIMAFPALCVPALVLSRVFVLGSPFLTIPQPHTHNLTSMRNPEEHIISYQEASALLSSPVPSILGGFYTPTDKDAPWFVALKAAMLGARMEKGVVNLQQSGSNTIWTLPDTQ